MEGNGGRTNNDPLKKTKRGKSLGLDSDAVEMLKCGSNSIIEWLQGYSIDAWRYVP